MGIKHNYQSATANDPGAEISSTRWNEAHTIDEKITLPAVAGDVASPAEGDLWYDGTADKLKIRDASASRSVLMEPTSASNDDILQRKSGSWVARTMAQLAADLSSILSVAWSSITGKPTTLAGYGISDTKANFDTALSDGNFVFVGDSVAYSSLSGLPTTLAGYGITDAVKTTDDPTALPKFNFKKNVHAMATGNVTLSGAQTVDGVATVNGRRYACFSQTTTTQNGIYVANHSGAWTRATDCDSADEVTQAVYSVEEGTSYASGLFLINFPAAGVVGTDAMGTAQIATEAGFYISSSVFGVYNDTGSTVFWDLSTAGVGEYYIRIPSVTAGTYTLVLADAVQTLTNKSIAATQLTGTLQAAQEPAHTGDVTNTAGSLAMTIAPNAVTNTKMATMAANTVKANATNGSATPTDVAIGASQLFGRGATGDLTAITIGTNLSFSGSTLNASGGSSSPGGSTTQVQYNNAGAFTGAAEVEIENDQLRLEETTSFTAPAANGVKLIAVERDAKNSQPAWLDAAGVPIPMMGDLFQIGGMGYQAIGGANTMTAIGIAAPSAIGTATAFTPTTASLYTKTPVLEWLVTTASTTAIAGFRTLNGMLTVGGASAGKGGLYWFGRFGPATGVATATNRCVFGLRALTSAPTDAQPSNQVSCAFFGWDDTDTNMQFMSNDASGACTKVDLGASFPVPTADRTKTFDCWMYSPPGTPLELYWRIMDRATGAVASGVVTNTADLPASTTRLSPTGWCSVGGTSSVIGFGLHAMNWRPIVVD